MRSPSLVVLALLATLIVPMLPVATHAAETEHASASGALQADVVIYGGTPAGIAAAIEVARTGRAVAIIEPYSWIGGLITNGLVHADYHSDESLSGTFLDFAQRVERHYVAMYGADAPQVTACFGGTHPEPHVARKLFEEMLAEHPSIRVLLKHRLTSVETSGTAPHQRVTLAHVVDESGNNVTLTGRVWIDASYEGDFAALAGVTMTHGREGRDQYGESLAPEAADEAVQGYNFRLVMTKDPKLRVPVSAPAGYDRNDFVELLPLLEAGRFKEVFCYPSGGLYKAHEPALPNGKHDINDVSRGLVRLSLPDINNAWPTGDAATRQQIFDEHVRHNVGMLYFLQNDPAVPTRYRELAREWGWCRDEFVDNGHLPEQLYVREARRMMGRHVFTEQDTDHAPGDARAVLQPDAIAMADYGPNCHGTGHTGSRFGGRHTGEFYKRVPAYQIPYGVLLPKSHDNLLVPVACSASHVGFCALRLEPVWMSLGQAAGLAAEMAIANDIDVPEVDVPTMQQRLHARRSATIYVTDVLPGDADFAAVQWWGTLGGLHGLEPMPEQPGPRGKHLVSQYYEAAPGHAVKLGNPLTDGLRQRWMTLAKKHGVEASSPVGVTTRGAFIRAAFAEAKKEAKTAN